MSYTQAQVERLLPHFEGLVKTTAKLVIEDGVEMEYDDVCQILRVKVWQAIQKFSDDRAAASKHLSHERDRFGRSPIERFVFGAVTNLRFDLTHRHVRRHNKSIDALREAAAVFQDGDNDHSSDWFDARFLSVSEDEVYGAVIEPELPDLPLDFTDIERQVVLLCYRGVLMRQIDRELGLSAAQRRRVLESARAKLGRQPDEAAPGPTPPLPGAAPRSGRVRLPLAA